MTADSIRKGQGTGKGPPAGGAHKGPAGKDVHLNKPVQKSHVDDEEPADGPAPKPDGGWSVRMTTPKAIGLTVGLLACMGAVVVGTIRYEDMKAAAALRAKLAQAAVRQAELHHTDGETYQQIALVDSIRRCVSATVATPDWVVGNGLTEATVDAIGIAAETKCLGMTLSDAARDFVVAREVARVAPDDAAKQAEANRWSDYIRFIVTFSKMKGYAIPAEFKAYATDITILDRFGGSEGVKPPERAPEPIWKR
ncbi:MAG: hypothetical protein HQL37_13905 [Alphaproteobacteria bacterium]|nr:hypothetical protein [Alphaproteobacteria bacterium]